VAGSTVTVDVIKIQGLAEFNRSLRQISSELPKELRQALNVGAQLVVDWAAPRVPARSGRARRSVRATSTRTAAQVTGGGARTPYYPWLDFGGRVGRKRRVHRPFLAGGRYIYPGYDARKDEVHDEVVRGLIALAERAGVLLEESGG